MSNPIDELREIEKVLDNTMEALTAIKTILESAGQNLDDARFERVRAARAKLRAMLERAETWWRDDDDDNAWQLYNDSDKDQIARHEPAVVWQQVAVIPAEVE